MRVDVMFRVNQIKAVFISVWKYFSRPVEVSVLNLCSMAHLCLLNLVVPENITILMIWCFEVKYIPGGI